MPPSRSTHKRSLKPKFTKRCRRIFGRKVRDRYKDHADYEGTRVFISWAQPWPALCARRWLWVGPVKLFTYIGTSSRHFEGGAWRHQLHKHLLVCTVPNLYNKLDLIACSWSPICKQCRPKGFHCACSGMPPFTPSSTTDGQHRQPSGTRFSPGR